MMQNRLLLNSALIRFGVLVICTILNSTVSTSQEVNMTKDLKTIRTQATSYFLEGDFDRSFLLYQKLVPLASDDPLVSERMGTLALYKNRYDEAIEWYQKSLLQTPWYDRLWPFSASLHYRIALAHYRKNSFNEAAPYFKKPPVLSAVLRNSTRFIRICGNLREQLHIAQKVLRSAG